VTTVPEISGLSHGELQALLLKLLGKVTELERIVADQREEIARLKGLKGRPDIKPSGMEKGTTPKPPRRGKRRGRGKFVPRVSVEEEIRQVSAPADRGSRATRISSCRTWCCAAGRSAIAANAGSRRRETPSWRHCRLA
jgi:hypothetical protein